MDIYAFDERYSVPHWRAIDADPACAGAVAQEILDAHQHYQRVEIWLEDQQLAHVQRDASNLVAV